MRNSKNIFYLFAFAIVILGTQKKTLAQLDSNDFVITWKTDNSGISNDSAIFFENHNTHHPIYVDVDNDGIFDSTFTGNNFSIQFSKPGTYTIRIKGNINYLYFGPIYSSWGGGISMSPMDKDKLISIDQWGNSAWHHLARAFYKCTNLKHNAIDSPNFDSLVSPGLYGMFEECTSFDGDLSAWDVSNVVEMDFMFAFCDSFNGNLSNWNVSNVESMNGMFWDASSFNQPLDNWNVSNVKSMVIMFTDAIDFNQNLGNWSIDSVIDMSEMLSGSGLSKDNYDSTLIGWQGKSHPGSLTLGAIGLEYCLGEAARDSLIANGWTFIGDTIDPACVLTSIKESSNQSIKQSEVLIYPNPSNGNVFLEVGKVNSTSTLFIYNQMGQMVREERIQEGRNQLDLRGLEKGMYYLKLIRENQIITKKILLQ